MQTSRELVYRAMEFRNPERIPICLCFDEDDQNWENTKSVRAAYDSDIVIVSFDDPEFVPVEEGYTIWGYKMENFGETMGEVKDYPIKTWNDFEKWRQALPDFTVDRGYRDARSMRKKYPDRFLAGGLGMMMENMLNLRGYEEAMVDYYEEEDNLNSLIDVLYDCGRKMADGYARAGMNAVIAWEDWGLQNTPMISYALWKEFYYERMKAFVDYIHSKGMKYILHSCGHITYLLDTFVEMGVDVIQMDQQMNMGLDILEAWKGKICFMCPVDIQYSSSMQREEMGRYVQQMYQHLDTGHGGLIYKSYAQPAAIHMPERKIMDEIEFMMGIKNV